MTESTLKLSTRKVADGIFELKIEGFIDFSTSEQVESAIEDIFAKGSYKVIVDLSQTKYISSAGFGCFISSIDTAMKNSGDIVFSGTPPEIKEIFDILGLSKILKFTREPQEAVKLLTA